MLVLQYLKNDIVNFKSNSVLSYNKGQNFWKSISTWKIPHNWIFPYWKNIELHLLPLLQPSQAWASKQAESATQ